MKSRRRSRDARGHLNLSEPGVSVPTDTVHAEAMLICWEEADWRNAPRPQNTDPPCVFQGFRDVGIYPWGAVRSRYRFPAPSRQGTVH